MSKGDPILLPIEKAEKVLDSDQQIIKITDEQGNWTGQTLNKSFLVSTDVDIQASREEMKRLGREENQQLSKPDERGTPEMKDVLGRFRPSFDKEFKEKMPCATL